MLEKNNIAMPVWDGSPQCTKVWGDVSAAYAKQVTGKVRAVVGTLLRKGNIWENVELPRLKNNIKVTNITLVAPETEKLMTIFNR